MAARDVQGNTSLAVRIVQQSTALWSRSHQVVPFSAKTVLSMLSIDRADATARKRERVSYSVPDQQAEATLTPQRSRLCTAKVDFQRGLL